MHDDGFEESEVRVLRERVAELEELLDTIPDRAPSGACAVVTVVGSAGGGSSLSIFFTVQAQTPGGTETEGGQGTLSPTGETFVALSLGGTAPPQNTPVIAREAGGRWVFRFG